MLKHPAECGLVVHTLTHSAGCHDTHAVSLSSVRAIRGIGQVKKNRIKRLRTSVEEIIKNNTGQIRSVAIKRNSFMRNNIRRQMNKGATDEKLLSIACKANDIDSSRLSQSAKEDIIKCLKTIYPE